jgi:hypothetical protein
LNLTRYFLNLNFKIGIGSVIHRLNHTSIEPGSRIKCFICTDLNLGTKNQKTERECESCKTKVCKNHTKNICFYCFQEGEEEVEDEEN